MDPGKSVVLVEASRIGAGASGRTGGMALAETAAGDVPGLGDVLAGLKQILGELEVDCDLHLPGAWEIARTGNPKQYSPIDWNDSGRLRVAGEVPGGTLDPGKLVSGLARAAHRLGATLIENQAVKEIEWREPLVLKFDAATMTASGALFATNALSLRLSGIQNGFEPRLTLAIASEPLSEDQLDEAGLSERKPFYTADLPYLWGRVCANNATVWGSGLVAAPRSGDLRDLSIASAEPSRLLRSLEARIRGLHPVFRDAEFTRRWGGPILFRESWLPVFDHHPKSQKAMVLGAYAGHGVTLSSYLGAWAAEALVGRRELPRWGKIAP